MLTPAPMEVVVLIQSKVGAKVCQACGELGTYDSQEGFDAGHFDGGDFVGFSPGHAQCSHSPYPAYVRLRPTRFCELCREEVAVETATRAHLSWICVQCWTRLSSSNRPIEELLDELASRRYAEFGPHRPHLGRGPELAEEWELDGHPRVPPPDGWLPTGLHRCDTCGEPRGTTRCPDDDGTIGEIESLCLCAGPPCVKCGRPRSHRPVSDHYDDRDGTWWHTSHFVGFKKLCDLCSLEQGE